MTFDAHSAALAMLTVVLDDDAAELVDTGVMGPVFDEMVEADADPLVVSALLKMASTLVIAMSEITDRSTAEILTCLRTGDFSPLFEDG